MNPILDYGMSKFEIADDQTEVEYLKQQGLKRKNPLTDLGVFYIALIVIALLFVLLLITWLCVKRLACCMKLLSKIKAKLVMTMPI